MSDVVWTTDQQSAIEVRDAKVLVNAAAGSGKTAVLTSRIIKRLIPDNDEQPVRADRLLVVTFTRAAAAEMRERIERGLKVELIKASKSGDAGKRRFISNQIKHLAAAKISTIDSFCQSLVKEYFHILKISPVFQIIQTSEERLMREEVFESMSDRLYREKNPSFLLLVNSFARSGREDSVLSIVEKLYDFSSTFPYPEKFIDESAEQYLCKNGFENTIWAKNEENALKERLKVYLDRYNNFVKEQNKNSDVRRVVEEEIKEIEDIYNSPYLEKLDAMKAYKCMEVTLSDDSFDELRHKIAASINALANDLLTDTKQREEALARLHYPQARALADITIEFKNALDDAKRKKSVLSFSDIERMAYSLLEENDEIREEIKGRYDEILIDEYQDTNALQDGIFEMITDEKNLFMVGDMKQSIYRFRGSEPLVFRNKADKYVQEIDAKERKITLGKNFRSRSEVLASVNDLFECCMSRVVGEIEYDINQRLNLGNDGYNSTGENYKSEFVLIEQDKSADDSQGRAELEAEYIAKRIIEMKKNGFMVRDKIKTGIDGEIKVVDGVRPIRNSDIIILMSSHKTDGKVFREIFSKYGIDCYCEQEGFFSKPEIKLIMSVLQAIENPENDIAVVAVMRSVVGGFTDDEIALIKVHERSKGFFDALCSVYSKYLRLKENGEISAGAELFGEKVAGFVEKLNLWRDKSRYMSAERMVNMLYEQTGIYSFFSATDSGEAKANLQLFFERAKQYESSGYRGLFAFLRHIERLNNSGEDLEGAGFVAGGDFVRIMTIHKSKGLETPVIFLAGAGKRFNTMDTGGSLLLHNRLGFSLDYVDYNANIHIPSEIKDIFINTISEELLSEEMRKLYVALTRAKEKIIVTATIEKNSKTEDKLNRWEELGASSMITEAGNAKTFTDWLAPVSMNSDNWTFEYVEEVEAATVEIKKAVTKGIELPDTDTAVSMLSFKYPYHTAGIKSKAAVSDFKGIEMHKLPEKPAFMSEKRISGAEFGTVVHKVMETLPREKGTDKTFVERHIESLKEAGFISEEVSKMLNAEKILKFYKSEIGQRLMAAKTVYTESEFEIGVDAAKMTGDDTLKGEEFLLQGVIDCWFEEEDGIVLIDYKTDRVQEIDEIHQKYDIQLELYSDALEKIAKKRVKEKFIYLFSLDCVVQC
ncbi:MAG: helicase-exonuclease AddAB subunit AddA [Eubacteriales bacterium]|nr:helicase-exonuclease AddAB subunit AddA [Eubacteriales bacterium]